MLESRSDGAMEVPPPVVVRLPPPTTLLTHGSSSGSSDGGGWPGLGIGSGHQRQRQRITAGWKPQPQKLRRQARSVVGASAGVAGVAAAAASQQPQASLDSFAARGRAEGRSGMQGCRGAGSGDAPRLTLGLPESARGLALCMGGGGGAFFGGVGASKAISLWPFSLRGRKPAGDDGSGKKRVLIMMSNTGGGHRASAEALKQAFTEKHGKDYEILIEDMWMDHTPPPFCDMPKSYSFLVQHSFLWWASYVVMQPKWVHVPYLRAAHAFIGKAIGEAFDRFNPDLVVSVHPMMQHVPLQVLRSRIQSKLMQPINFATVVTDFTTCHNTWFHAGVTRCFVPTDFCRELGRANGLSSEQLVQHGLPIRPVFSKPLPPKPRIKARLGLPKNVPAVLLVGGGEGMGKLEDTVDEMAGTLGGKVQAVVICGRNKQLLQRLQSKRYESGMHVTPVGFVNNIHEYMGAADAIITKAGPGTIAEALIAGLPILLNGNVPCQEEGNIPFVVDNKVGAFETRPKRIARILDQWLDPSFATEFAQMAARSKALGRPEAVYKIVDDLASLAQVPDYKHGPASVRLLAT
mmetsp:Transcript_33368/g.99359  ORF Transcript_33368/g.99359 Transcript_33368/m.99359 type:complete len:576 (-) Transcript_33368:456-2183(-)